jgi:hypothetical protein
MCGCSICAKILCKIGDGIALDLHMGSSIRITGCGGRVDPGSMIHKIGGKSRIFVLFVLHVTGKLMH